MSELDEKLTGIRQQLQTRVNGIRNDAFLTGEGKTALIAKAWLDAKAEEQALRQKDEQARESRDRQLTQRYFGLNGPEATDPSAMISLRDAQDRVSSIDEVGDLTALMDRALLNGDTIMQKAVLALAFDRGWADPVNIYTKHNPVHEAGVEELWAIRNETSINALAARHFALEMFKPHEIAVMNDHLIRVAAARQPTDKAATRPVSSNPGPWR